MKQVHGGNAFRYGDMLDVPANLNSLGMSYPVRRAVIASAQEWD